MPIVRTINTQEIGRVNIVIKSPLANDNPLLKFVSIIGPNINPNTNGAKGYLNLFIPYQRNPNIKSAYTSEIRLLRPKAPITERTITTG